MKTCNKCRESKPLAEFPPNKGGALGRHSHCRACKNAVSRKWNSANKQRTREIMHAWPASLDRIDPALGYVRGNLQVISFKANRIKSNATADELMRVAKYMVALSQPALKAAS